MHRRQAEEAQNRVVGQDKGCVEEVDDGSPVVDLDSHVVEGSLVVVVHMELLAGLRAEDTLHMAVDYHMEAGPSLDYCMDMPLNL